MAIKNALIDVRFTLDIPESHVERIAKNNELDPKNDEHYERICNALHEWALDNWTTYLDWITNGEPEIEVTA